MTQTYEQQSRKNWIPGSGLEKCSGDQLKTGCLQRIADATELMAKNHVDLVESRDSWERAYRSAIRREDSLTRRLTATRGHLTRLKNQIKEMK